jgi:outer membrane protein OmpA-like peptidoglycan-associated protein
MAGEREYKYEATAELLLDKKSVEHVDISKGKGVLKKLQDGKMHFVKLVIDARFSGPLGPNDDTILKGFPLGKKFEVTWTVDVDGGKVKIFNSPKKVESKEQLTPGDECELKESDNGDSVVATVSCLGYNLGAADDKDSKVFVCNLEADKKSAPTPEANQLPKVSRDLIKTSAYFGESGKKGKDSADLPTGSLKDLEKWVKDIEKVEELYDVIADGSVPICLEGNTSKSGSKDYNAKLAKQRIDAVERKLSQFFHSSKVKFVAKPKAQSKFEEEHDYRVDVSFDKTLAENMMIANRL